MIKTCTHKEMGFSLIEVLVAVFIVATVSVSISALVSRTQKISGLGQEKLIGISLAREGLELTRAARDDNWFSGDENTQWVQGICTQQGGIAQFIIDINTIKQSEKMLPATDNNIFLYINNTTGTWSHAMAGATQAPYKFTRKISVDCSHASGQAEDAKEYITVTSRVTWLRATTGKEEEQEVSVTEKLYNWLPAQIKIQSSTPAV